MRSTDRQPLSTNLMMAYYNGKAWKGPFKIPIGEPRRARLRAGILPLGPLEPQRGGELKQRLPSRADGTALLKIAKGTQADARLPGQRLLRQAGCLATRAQEGVQRPVPAPAEVIHFPLTVTGARSLHQAITPRIRSPSGDCSTSAGQQELAPVPY
jgi:hypothetical protein